MPSARSADTGTRDWMTGCGSSCGDKPDALTPSACPADVDAVQIPDVTSLMELVRLPVVSDLLERVWWVGGSPCSGKSTLAQAVAAGCGVALYSCDDAFEPHAASVAPANGPTLKKVTSLGVTERLSQPIDVQVADVFKLYREEWPLILTDLQALSGPVVVEGAALLRSCWPTCRYRPTAQSGWFRQSGSSGTTTPGAGGHRIFCGPPQTPPGHSTGGCSATLSSPPRLQTMPALSATQSWSPTAPGRCRMSG